MSHYSKEEILSRVDHTLLKPEATWPQIQKLCDEAMEYHTASVCINTCYVRQAVEYMAGRVPVCCVVGFPLGAMDTRSKAFEAKTAVENGASEVDMVINIGWLKNKQYERPCRHRRSQGGSGGQGPQGHHRDLPAHRRGEGEHVRLVIDGRVPTSSRPAPASPLPAPPSMTSSCLPAASTAAARSRPRAAFPRWRIWKSSSTWVPTVWAPAAPSAC